MESTHDAHRSNYLRHRDRGHIFNNSCFMGDAMKTENFLKEKNGDCITMTPVNNNRQVFRGNMTLVEYPLGNPPPTRQEGFSPKFALLPLFKWSINRLTRKRRYLKMQESGDERA